MSTNARDWPAEQRKGLRANRIFEWSRGDESELLGGSRQRRDLARALLGGLYGRSPRYSGNVINIMVMPPLLEVALNGSRPIEQHPRIPRTPDELAMASRNAVEAGAQVLHLHPYDPDGVETFDPDVCAAALKAVRYECPGVPISLTTSAAIEPDPRRRFQVISQWHQLPDLVTANQGEVGIVELCEHLMSRGIGIEAGLLSVPDADRFIRSGLAVRCERVLIEPLDPDVDAALAQAAAMESILHNAGIPLEQVHHGEGVASWAVSARGLARGHGMRTGLEDTIYLPDGVVAANNAELVRTAATMLA